MIVTGPEQRLEVPAYAAELRARSRDYERFLEAERKRVFGDHRRKAEQYLDGRATWVVESPGGRSGQAT